jgi:Protein of unknown function (DUF2913)
LSDNIEPDLPENTTSALSHLAFCALVAPGMARQDGTAGTPWAENLFLIRWLATAQKQKRFPKSVAIDITWLLERGRKHGAAGKASIWNIYGVPVVAIWPPNPTCSDSPKTLKAH